MILAVRVTRGQERIVSGILERRVMDEHISGIYSMIYVDSFQGYILIEAESEGILVKLIYGIKHIKGYIKNKQVSEEEIRAVVSSVKTPSSRINVGDKVELVSGPFKGEKAKVIRIDESKGEATIEFIEVAVPMPTSVQMKMIKKIEAK